VNFVLTVKNLSKSYGAQLLFTDVSFNINPGERIGLVGRNGHGKTTLLRLIQGEELPDTGEIIIPNGYRLGYLEQHLAFREPTLLAEACLGLPKERKDEVWQVEKVLMGLGFRREDFTRAPGEFSGGFQIRLNLAKVLVSGVNLLMLDEPTNYLDLPSLRWLTGLLKNWPNELILITHDRGFMDQVITHTLGIHRQRIRKIPGGSSKYYEQMAKEEEIYEKTRLNEEKKRRAAEAFINRFRYKATLSSRVQSRIKALEKKGRMEKLAPIEELEFSFTSAPMPGKVLLETDGLDFSYDGKESLLISGFKLTVKKNDRIAVIGKNGKGKSTLMKLLAGELTPLRGEIRKHPLLQTGYFNQTNVSGLDPEKTVLEEILAVNPACTEQQARNIAGLLMFEGDAALKKISVLSGGERSRVILGKILVIPVNLLLLDEPTNHLDMESADALLAALDAFDGAVVIVTHNEMFLQSLANRLIVFDRGRVFLYEGGYQSFLTDIGWEDEEAGGNGPAAAGKNRWPAQDLNDRRNLRRERANTIQEKSAVLRPLAAEIERIETTIAHLEEEAARNLEFLAEASLKGDGEEIAAGAKRRAELETELEALYDRLAEITAEYEEKSAEYEARLKSLLSSD
jgi:ATP-binding cassette subfamily F protein 3